MGNTSHEPVVEPSLDEFLAHHSPQMKKKRRDKRVGAGKLEARPKKQQTDIDPSRRIPTPTRNAVFAKDKGRCTYVGSTGKRCGSARNFHVALVVPYARGGANTADNLRLLCAKYNRLEAERIYGRRAIERFHPRR